MHPTPLSDLEVKITGLEFFGIMLRFKDLYLLSSSICLIGWIDIHD